MISRTQAIDAMAKFAGPLGPFVSPEQREHDRDLWHAQLTSTDLPQLLDIAVAPPPASAYAPATWDQFELELIDSLAAAAKGNELRAQDAFAPLLANSQARPTLITVLGMLGAEESVAALDSLIPQHLTLDELIRMACALGDISAPAARGVLERLRSLPEAADLQLQSEIDIALGRIPI
jgi:hypothetical protein